MSEHQKRETNRKAIKQTASKLRELLADSPAVSKRVASMVGEALDELLAELNGEAKAA